MALGTDRIFSCAAVSAFGLEGAVAGELKRLGMKNVQTENGFIRFQANLREVFLCNLRLRFSDRVYLLLAEKACGSFEDLFQLVRSVPWERYMSGTEAVNISAQCARSRLMSVRDCQSVAKKAVLVHLKDATGRSSFPENGPAFPIHLQIHSDTVKVLLDTSGSSLSRRGYRTWNGEAPLRETLAASLVEFSLWRPGMPLYDPCCGTGTLLIEAALRQGHIAPGLRRSFALEKFYFGADVPFDRIREGESACCRPDRIQEIGGSDISPEAIELASRHVSQAGLDGCISLKVLPLQELNLTAEKGVFLCNPPYGERLGDLRSCR